MSPDLVRGGRRSDEKLDQAEIDRVFRETAQRFYNDPTIQIDRPHFDDDDVPVRKIRIPLYMLGHMGVGEVVPLQIPERKQPVRAIGVAAVVYHPARGVAAVVYPERYSLDDAPAVNLPTDYHSAPQAAELEQPDPSPEHSRFSRPFHRLFNYLRSEDMPQPYGAESHMGERDIKSHRRKSLLGRIAISIKKSLETKASQPSCYWEEETA